VPALVLSDIGGHELYQPEACAIPKDQLVKLLRDAFEPLARCGVGHGDLKLGNLHLIRDNDLTRGMVVDLESVEDVDPANSAFFVDSDIDHILRIYRNHQECLIDDGFLPKQQSDYTN
jgi:RIO-like serine/threonine protein kinase